MLNRRNFINLFFIIIPYFFVISNQASAEKDLSLFEKTEEFIGSGFQNPYQLTYLPIIQSSEKIYIDGIILLKDSDYVIDYKLGQINIKKEINQDSIIKIEYKIIPISLKKSYQRQFLTSQEEIMPIIEQKQEKSDIKKPIIDFDNLNTTPSDLNFSGTKTLSLSMENTRGLTINQPTRLNINGKISENISINALLSDEDLPLQPEGTTEKLEDLDKILIEIKGKHLSATLGDYEASYDDTEFVLSPKMLEGAQAKGDFPIGSFSLIVAVSKGQSATITLDGIEGQNEYRISLNGKFIIIVAGSEEVWLNGEKMRREHDYVIRDYGDPIIEFTNKHFLTEKDIIVVDFEYIDEDKNYGQKMYGMRGKAKWAKDKSQTDGKYVISDISMPSGINAVFGFSYATESDDKNNPIIPLNNMQIESLKLNDLDPDGDGVNIPAPTSNSIIGVDGRIDINNSNSLFGEFALNKHDSNTFSRFDKQQESKAWKINGASSGSKFRINFDLRGFDPGFSPIGATANSRNRGIYQKKYDEVNFGNFQEDKRSSSAGEKNYSANVWLKLIESVEINGNMGRASTEYNDPEKSKNMDNYWGRSLRIAIPNVPQINARYQEVTSKQSDTDLSIKTRESLQFDHKFLKILNVKLKNEEIKSLVYNQLDSGKNIKRNEQNLKIDLPSFWKISIFGDFSYDKSYRIKNEGQSIYHDILQKWIGSSSARTATINLSTKPFSWLDFSGYFGQRKLLSYDDSSSESDITSNVADMKLNLKYLKLNYQIDRKLSTEKEEQYLNYIVTLVDGQEVKRYLKPGEGSYVKIDDYTYREDMEKGEYIRLLRNISDKPVASLAFQTVFSIRPKTAFYKKKTDKPKNKVNDYLLKSINVLEIGTRINEEQDDTSKGFYVLSDLQTNKTIYGLEKYWFRTQVSPLKFLIFTYDWETSKTLNRRINNQSREIDIDRWKAKIESPIKDSTVLGCEFGKDDNQEKSSSIFSNIKNEKMAISNISELQKFRSIYIDYNPRGIISNLELRWSHETEWNDDALSEESAVLTKTSSLQAEAIFSFMGRGTANARYEIADGKSNGDLPFARYDFNEGISHKIRIETNYRLNWFTDLILRIIYRSEIAKGKKPNHQIEMELTADF